MKQMNQPTPVNHASSVLKLCLSSIFHIHTFLDKGQMMDLVSQF